MREYTVVMTIDVSADSDADAEQIARDEIGSRGDILEVAAREWSIVRGKQ